MGKFKRILLKLYYKIQVYVEFSLIKSKNNLYMIDYEIKVNFESYFYILFYIELLFKMDDIFD